MPYYRRSFVACLACGLLAYVAMSRLPSGRIMSLDELGDLRGGKVRGNCTKMVPGCDSTNFDVNCLVLGNCKQDKAPVPCGSGYEYKDPRLCEGDEVPGYCEDLTVPQEEGHQCKVPVYCVCEYGEELESWICRKHHEGEPNRLTKKCVVTWDKP